MKYILTCRSAVSRQTMVKKEVIVIYERMLNEYQRLEHQINLLKNQLDSLPEGKLICSQNQGYSKWYQSDGHEKTYIPKKNRDLAEQLAVKKYLSLQIKELLHEKNAIQLYLNHHSRNQGQAQQLLASDSAYHDLLAGHFTQFSQELAEWMSSPYQHNPLHPEQLIHKSVSGNMVRSKSEAIIDMFLYTNHIPFRYECALQLGEVTIYPDFTIRHPKTGEIYYWEHFGLIDYPEYSQKSYSKLHLYSKHQIFPSINLITTFETKDYPLSTDLVEKIIKYYFL